MDKKTLQTEILEKPYQPEKWREVLRDYFGAKKFHQKPVPVTLNGGDIAKSAVELGSFYTADERLVGLYEVHVTQRTWLDKNRVGLRDLLKQVIRHEVDGALIVFTKGEKWRFSFVSEIKTLDGKKETEPKRYTYLFGKGESCRTAAERFDKLKARPVYLNDLFDAFSVEKLNKDFFKSYKDFFGEFSNHLALNGEYRRILLGSPEVLEKGWEDPSAKPLRDFVKMLLGRIVFLQFLQKKGWMGVPSNNTDWTGGDTRFLQNLFMNTTHKDNFHSKVLKTLFFETLNSKRENQIAPAALGSNIKIPYLNGGLFDKDVSYEYDIDFPRDMFKELLDFFESYNFTIDENDPYDNEVGIDPEMLGHIFENLLEENRAKGAFYTPKEIVHYMCQESLIQYLRTHLPECTEDESPATKAIENFIRNGEIGDRNNKKNFVVQQAKRIERLLDNIKVCDPAIGSGAFPMGMLQEIFKAKTSLDLTLDHSEVKKQIIQNNLYGVDIENGAVEIARLRFWLALVVDETEPRPLPNLDYKIMQGNSLLESFEGIDLSNVHAVNTITTIYEPDTDLFGRIHAQQLNFTDAKVLRENNLHQLMQTFFNEIDAEKKQEIRLHINKTVHDHIDYNLELRQLSLERQIAEASKINNLELKTSPKKKIGELRKQLKGLKESRKKLHELQSAVNKPYFLWHLFFADVFEKGGFDIVIANPPYINIEKLEPYIKEYIFELYKTCKGRTDIYIAFIEKSLGLLKKNGGMIMIIPYSYTKQNYGSLSRKSLIEEYNIREILDTSDYYVFDSAVVKNIVLRVQNNLKNSKTIIKRVHSSSDFANRLFAEFKVDQTTFSDSKNYRLQTSNIQLSNKIKFKIWQNSSRLQEVCFVAYGARLNHRHQKIGKEAYVYKNYKAGYKPFTEGKNIDRFTFNRFGWLDYQPEIHYNSMFREMFESEKLIFINVVKDRLRFAYDNKGYYNSHTVVNCIKWHLLQNVSHVSVKRNINTSRINLSEKYSYKFLLGLLNSSLINWYFVQYLSESLHFYPDDAKELPITNDLSKTSIFEFLITKIIELKTNKLDSSFYENKIDALVFHLYSLSEQETLQVLESFDFLSIKDRNQIQNEYWNIANNKFQLET